jgi:hypothetical protein
MALGAMPVNIQRKDAKNAKGAKGAKEMQNGFPLRSLRPLRLCVETTFDVPPLLFERSR